MTSQKIKKDTWTELSENLGNNFRIKQSQYDHGKNCILLFKKIQKEFLWFWPRHVWIEVGWIEYSEPKNIYVHTPKIAEELIKKQLKGFSIIYCKNREINLTSKKYSQYHLKDIYA